MTSDVVSTGLDVVFVVLMTLILIVAVYGLISARRDRMRRNRQLAKLIARLSFNGEVCGKCVHKTDCVIYALATDPINKRCHKHQG
jgi:hypothetical protein